MGTGACSPQVLLPALVSHDLHNQTSHRPGALTVDDALAHGFKQRPRCIHRRLRPAALHSEESKERERRHGWHAPTGACCTGPATHFRVARTHAERGQALVPLPASFAAPSPGLPCTPPTMKVKLPACAPGTPPDTGASIIMGCRCPSCASAAWGCSHCSSAAAATCSDGRLVVWRAPSSPGKICLSLLHC